MRYRSCMIWLQSDLTAGYSDFYPVDDVRRLHRNFSHLSWPTRSNYTMVYCLVNDRTDCHTAVINIRCTEVVEIEMEVPLIVSCKWTRRGSRFDYQNKRIPKKLMYCFSKMCLYGWSANFHILFRLF